MEIGAHSFRLRETFGGFSSQFSATFRKAKGKFSVKCYYILDTIPNIIPVNLTTVQKGMGISIPILMPGKQPPVSEMTYPQEVR